MASLNVHLDYFDHPKTKTLIRLLSKGAEVIPIKLWCYCGKYHAEDGRLARYAAQDIEEKVGWWGTKGKCVAALVEAGFLDKEPEGYAVHDWADHAGHIHAFKERARKGAIAKWEKVRAGVDASSIACSNAITGQGSARHVSANGGTTAAERKKAEFRRLVAERERRNPK